MRCRDRKVTFTWCCRLAASWPLTRRRSLPWSGSCRPSASRYRSPSSAMISSPRWADLISRIQASKVSMFWIRILPMLFKHIWTWLQKTMYLINQKEDSTNYLPFSTSQFTSHYSLTVLQTDSGLYCILQYSLESSGLKIRNKFFIYLLFHSC